MNNVADNLVVFKSLTPGAWAISVIAKNAANKSVGHGSTSDVNIEANKVAEASVTVKPFSGHGSLIISLSWPGESVVNPQVTGTLTSSEGDETEMNFSMGTDNLSASYNNSELEAGYYTLSLKLRGDHSKWDLIDIVRIVVEDTTSTNITITEDKIRTIAGANLNIINQMDDPIEISFSGQSDNLAEGNNLEISSIASESVNYYQWYLNGNIISGANSATLTIGQSLEVGNYLLDLLVKKDNVICVEGLDFNVIPVASANMGITQWAKTATETVDHKSSFLNIATAADGSVYTVGKIDDGSTVNFGNGVSVANTSTMSNFFLVKYDSNGVAQWGRTISSTESNSHSYLFNVSTASDGSIYTVGYIYYDYTYNFGNDVSVANPNDGNSIVIVKYNSSGEAQWAQTIQSTRGSSSFRDVAVAQDGSIYAVGTVDASAMRDFTYSFGNGVSVTVPSTSPEDKTLIVKYNSAGEAQWAKSSLSTVSGNTYATFRSVGISSDGSVYAAGYIQGTVSFDFGNSVSAAGSYADGENVVLIKYNSSGETQWAKTVVSGDNRSYFDSIGISSDGSIYAAGRAIGSNSYDLGNSVSITPSHSAENIMLVKYNSDGETQWAQTSVSGSSITAFHSVAVSQDGSVTAGGFIEDSVTHSFGNGISATGAYSAASYYANKANVLLVKYSSDGLAQWAQTTTAASSYSYFKGIALGPDNSLYGVGTFSGIQSFDFGNSVTITGSNSLDNMLFINYK